MTCIVGYPFQKKGLHCKGGIDMHNLIQCVVVFCFVQWEALGIKYPLEGMEPPPKEVVNYWRSYIAEQGIRVIL